MDQEAFCEWCEQTVSRSGIGWFDQYATVNGERIHYVEAGRYVRNTDGDLKNEQPEDRSPLVLLHGFMAWSYTWRHNLPVLAKHSRVLAPDFRGFGLSERNPRRGHSLSDQVDLLRQFLDQLGIDEAVLCGSSMGGEIALRFALRYPRRVRALILSAASGYVKREQRPVERWLMRLPLVWSLWARAVVMNRGFVGRTLRAAYRLPEKVAERDVDAYLLPARIPGSPATFGAMIRDMDFGRFAGRWSDIAQPALLIWGENDPWVPLEHGRRLAAAMPNAELIALPSCGHLPHEEYPEAFNQAVSHFLQRVVSPGQQRHGPLH